MNPSVRQFAAGAASGLVATPVSTSPGEYLVWFRPERVRTVTWGGDPRKPVVEEAGPRLHPRTSFEMWKETVRLRSLPSVAAPRIS